MNVIKKFITWAFYEPYTRYTVIITACICIAVFIQFIWNSTSAMSQFSFPEFLVEKDISFIESFMQWFGVVYGLLMPLILINAWELFDEIDNVFSRELETVKILYEDALSLHVNNQSFQLQLIQLLFDYIEHICTNYIQETIDLDKRTKGDDIPKKIRRVYIFFIQTQKEQARESESLTSEFLGNLNGLLSHRGNRISIATKRLYQVLKMPAIVASVVWLVPLIFLLKNGLGIFSFLLVTMVIFLAVVILAIIEDLDDPFEGYWRVDIESWINLRNEISNEISIKAGKQQRPNIL